MTATAPAVPATVDEVRLAPSVTESESPVAAAPSLELGGASVAVSGFFPVWENTASILGHGHIMLGSSTLAVGLGDRVQLGVNPLRFAFRTPNLGIKVRLFQIGALRLAASAEVTWFLPGSSESFTTSNISTRLDTSRLGSVGIPVALISTFEVTKTVHVNVTLTGLTTVAKNVEAWLGASAVAEWTLFENHTLAVHLTEVGVWRHDFVQFGGSYRYRRGIFEGRLGVAYQLRDDGSLVIPNLSLGVEL